MSEQIAKRSENVPALLDEAERALALVSSTEDAESLWRKLKAIDHVARLAKAHADLRLRAGCLQLRAERKWGDLLGPAENHGPATLTASQGSTNADHKSRQRAREVAAVPTPVFENYLAKVRDPETLRRARLLRVAREHEAEQRRAEPVAPVSAIGGAEIRHGDLREVLADVTADAIITDPPYPRKYLDEFDALGELAASILKPDGVLAVMVGQTHLPDYIERLARHVPYRWCAAYLTEGPATRIHGRKVGTKWKPVLIFGESTRFLTQDVFMSRGDDKAHHHWGQSESGMADIVERLTEPGDLVVDPFVGGGTTALVCQELGRRFIGCDVDAAAVHATTERLAA